MVKSRLTNFLIQIENMRKFHPLEVVGSRSETQPQVGKNLNYLIYRFKGGKIMILELPVRKVLLNAFN